jgi:glycosyltransferase involved in cell wall biosynthesis
MKPNISVIVPTLNSAATLDMTLLSLHTQKNCGVKVQVVDSGSTDGTLDICSRWGVSPLYVPPGNMYRAINRGLDSCATTWLMYLNSDDFVFPDSLERLINFGEQARADVVYGSCDYVDAEGRFLHSFTPAAPGDLQMLAWSGNLGFAQQAVIFCRTLYERLGSFNELYSLTADLDFYWRAAKTEARFARLLGPSVACFRLSAGQLSHTRTQEMREQTRALLAAYWAKPGLRDRLTLLRWRVANWPQYGIRILRRAALSGRLGLPKTMDTLEKG